MTITAEVELRPFTTPNFVIQRMAPVKREEGFKEAPKYALSELEPSVLSELCDTFRREIFEKAGKADPKGTLPKGND